MKKIILVCLVALFSIGAVNAQKPKKGEKQTVTVEFMTSLDCEGCAKKINDTLPYEKGVRDVKVDVPTKVVTVTYDPAKTNNEAIIKAFAKVKIDASVKGACADGCCGHHHDTKPAEKMACEDDCCSGHDHKH
ncbi:MAG: heavy-metal-associated domain-containing protein [Alistipes sp.]|nr:heavy-metal-associated domain-containing protein [Alistipes sp.]